MNWINSVCSLVARDLHRVPRQTWFYPKRTMFGGLAGLILASSFLLLDDRTSVPGLFVFKCLTVGIAILVFLVAAAAGAHSLVAERENQTLDLVLISTFTPAQVIVAKQLSGLAHTFVTALAAAPMLAICAALGGISPRLAIVCAALLAAILFASHGLGLCLAAQLASARQIKVYNGVITATLALVLPAFLSIVFSVFELENTSMLILASPFYAILATFAEQPVRLIWLHTGLLGLLGLALLAVAAWRLPHSLVPPRPAVLAQFREDLRSTRTMRALVARPGIEGNPVAWMDLYLVFGGRRLNWLKLLFASCLLTAIVLSLCSLVDLTLAEAWRKVWLYLTLLHGVTFVFGTISACSMAFQRERLNGSLDILLTSDLNERDLFYGKIMGTFYGASPYATCLFVSFCLAIAVTDNLSTYGSLLISAVLLTSVVYACCSAALYLSMRLRAPAGVAAFGVVYTFVWALICFAFPAWQRGIQAYFILGLIAVIWHVYLGTLCWRLMLRQGRNLLLAIPITDEPPLAD